ncbi:MAG: hypothetical protein V4664_02590 [Patescibacteria group bacterium]
MRLTKSGRACLTKANLNAVGIVRITRVDYDTEGVGWDVHNGTRMMNEAEFVNAVGKLRFRDQHSFLRAIEKAKTKGMFDQRHGVMSAFQ